MAGSVKLVATPGLEAYYGPAPHVRFLESAWPGTTDDQLYEAIRGGPRGMAPEDFQRYLERRLPPKISHLLPDVLVEVQRKFEEEGPFDCILGHSEGAVIAATYVVASLKKSAGGNNNMVRVAPKCAVFMNGTTPHTADGKGWLRADECGQVISIPTCHITAHNDVMADQAVALYHLCNDDLADIVDHGRGHMIPRDEKSSKLMLRGIRDLMERTKDLANVEDGSARVGESGWPME